MNKTKQIKILKNKPPKHMKFTPTDCASNIPQARDIAASYPKDMDIKIVKTGKRGDVYPYTIYSRERITW